MKSHARQSAQKKALKSLRLESLEARQMLAVTLPAISISDASAIEGDQSLRSVDRFVADGSGGLTRARSLILGNDGNGDGVDELYISSADTNEILRYDGNSGAFLGAFVSAGSGGLDSPGDLAFHPDGNLYVTSLNNGQVLRYEGTTGAFLGVAASGLNSPLGLTIAADGSLFIANQFANEVLRYNSTTGLTPFVAAGSGGLNRPRHAVFGPDGNGDGIDELYVASAGTNQILRYDGLTGAPLGAFANLATSPTWVEFGHDGLLYTTHRTGATCCETSITRFDAQTGALVDTLALGRDGWSFFIGPDNLVYNSTNDPASGNYVERFGIASLAVTTISLDSASTIPVDVDFSTVSGSATGSADYTSVSSTLTFAPGQTTRTIIVPTTDDSLTEASETFSVVLSNPQGASIADGSGAVTIVDDDGTKFYVVNDATGNETFEYNPTGGLVEVYGLHTANTAPRGATSTVSGDRVWVVDANRKVYVYNSGGSLLGSWTAGSLASTANVQGIATNGIDIWIVDAKSDKVYRYAGAATRLSGSQNAASSFSLNAGNTDATDMVTDGTSLWVTNNTSTNDKVFKYSVSGSLAGSWVLAAGGGSPTGITLDLNNNRDLWIVDNATDLVYQYVGAATRTSGSQSATTSFSLAPGNTNAQGIADPPVGAFAASPPVLRPRMLDAKASAAVAHLMAAAVTTTSRKEAAVDTAFSTKYAAVGNFHTGAATLRTYAPSTQASNKSQARVSNTAVKQRMAENIDDLMSKTFAHSWEIAVDELSPIS